VSNKVFTILSNNKEQGPYSLEEVLQLSLKPQDLVWEEGSIGWRAPSEIITLQPYFNTKQTNPVKSVTNTSRIFISYPKKTSAPPQLNSLFQTDAPSTREDGEPTAESLEIRAARMYQRVMAYNDQKQHDNESGGSDTVYSLQNLRQEYALWNQQQNKKEITYPHLKLKKTWWLKSGIASVIAIGIFIALRGTTFKDNERVTPQILKTNSIFPVVSKKINNPEPAKSSVKQNISILSIQKDMAEKVDETIPKELTVDEFIDSVRQAMARHDKLMNSSRFKKSSYRSSKK